jgi:hypothetical protein
LLLSLWLLVAIEITELPSFRATAIVVYRYSYRFVDHFAGDLSENLSRPTGMRMGDPPAVEDHSCLASFTVQSRRKVETLCFKHSVFRSENISLPKQR